MSDTRAAAVVRTANHNLHAPKPHRWFPNILAVKPTRVIHAVEP